jgi:hypothetical protein
MKFSKINAVFTVAASLVFVNAAVADDTNKEKVEPQTLSIKEISYQIVKPAGFVYQRAALGDGGMFVFGDSEDSDTANSILTVILSPDVDGKEKATPEKLLEGMWSDTSRTDLSEHKETKATKTKINGIEFLEQSMSGKLKNGSPTESFVYASSRPSCFISIVGQTKGENAAADIDVLKKSVLTFSNVKPASK